MPLTNGQTFAGYTIIRPLGSGGMGEVYLAQHPRLPRRDALKLLPHDWSADAEYRARFNREADLASTLWHPHIVGVHDRGEEDGQLWISMDFVDGLDAAKLLSDRYPAGMLVEEVARIVTAVASALDYAHKQSLLHRDVKPANIMLTHLDDEGEQRILLTDFGIARNVNEISGLTATNVTVGTVAYCAPEQLLGEEIDGRADQYSLAATAYHLLTGSQLFPNSNPAVVISHHLNVPPPALADSRLDLAKLDPVLAIALAKRPEDRFKRCSDFARALNEQIDSAGAPIASAPTAPAVVGRPAVDAIPPRDNSVDRNEWDAAPLDERPMRQRLSLRTKVLFSALAVVAVVVMALVLIFVGRKSTGGEVASSTPTATSSTTTSTTGSQSPTSVDKSDVASQITLKMTDADGNKPDSVDCPNDLPAKVGAQVNCEMKVKSQTFNVDVTVTSVNGNDVKYDMVETVDKNQVANVISYKLTQQVGRKPDSVTCPDNLKGTVGATLRCQLTDGNQKYGISVTVTNVDAGAVNFDFNVDNQPS
jgi:serine/threonine-protein kinase